jgi:transposase-like protein
MRIIRSTLFDHPMIVVCTRMLLTAPLIFLSVFSTLTSEGVTVTNETKALFIIGHISVES